jgi:hypothetical protein
MSSAVITLEFAHLGREKKAQFLCRLGTRLTTVGRELYLDEELTISGQKRMRGLNEVHHRIFGQLGHLVENDQGYPDDVFVATLRLLAAENGLAAEFSDAWDAAAASFMQQS